MIAEREPAEGGAPPDPIDEEQFFRRHRVFVRRARDVSHQALFFLGLLYKTTSQKDSRQEREISHQAPFFLRLLDHIRDTASGRKAQEAVDKYSPFALEQIRSLVESVPLFGGIRREALRPEQAAIGEALELHDQWHNLASSLHRPEVDVVELRKSFEDFLKRSRTAGLIGRVAMHWLPDVYSYFRKNLALIWGILILLAVTLKAEAVNALLWNEFKYNPQGFLLPIVLLLVPLAVSRMWTFALHGRTPPTVPFWDISSAAFRSFRFQALEPGRLINRWPRGTRLRREMVKGQVVKLSVYALWWFAAFGLIYWLHKKSMLGASGSSLTVFMILSLCYAALIAAHMIDFWEYLDPQPVRFLMLVASLGGFVFLLLGWGREFFIIAFLVAAAGYLYAWSRDRESTLRLALAIFFFGLAAANFIGRGTYRCAEWTDEVRGSCPQEKENAPRKQWNRLTVTEWPWPGSDPVVVLAASGGGSRAAIYTGLTLRQLNEVYPDIAERLQAISSVSGGSLANAAYIARLLDLGEKRTDLKARSAALAGLNKAVGNDFLFPTLMGALIPGRTRGQSIEATWENKEVALGRHSLSELAAVWRTEHKRASKTPPFPIPLFNSTTLDGHDLVISPLERELYTWDEMEKEARDLKRSAYRRAAGESDPQTWVYYRDGIYALEDMLVSFDPKLSQAVRASANFPFGFPLVCIRTKQPLFFNPRDNDLTNKQVELTDGGALSNSGMWSLYHLLMPDEIKKREELKRRGVLLLVVEASKMPTYPHLEQSLNTLWSTIGDQGPVGQSLHRLMFKRLAAEYKDRIAIVQWDIISQKSYNVLTSWALDEDSIKRLDVSFHQRWEQENPTLTKAWNVLTGKTPGNGQAIISTNRPPLD